jgi:predicted RNA-binding protein associated with RNAse of E/G family
MKVVERKNRLDGSHVDFVCERLLLEPQRRAVLRYVVDRDWHIEGADLVVPRGTVTIAHYWAERPYNVYHWRAADRTLAYYCNVVSATSIEADQVSYDDLVVDVLIDPSGSALVLDEEDLPPDLAPSQRAVIARALEQLTGASRRLAVEIERESLPFL